LEGLSCADCERATYDIGRCPERIYTQIGKEEMNFAEYLANLEHSVKLLTERIDWLEIVVKDLQDKEQNRITDVHIYNDMSLDNLRQLIRSEMVKAMQDRIEKVEQKNDDNHK